jgi:hypothetical protein
MYPELHGGTATYPDTGEKRHQHHSAVNQQRQLGHWQIENKGSKRAKGAGCFWRKATAKTIGQPMQGVSLVKASGYDHFSAPLKWSKP